MEEWNVEVDDYGDYAEIVVTHGIKNGKRQVKVTKISEGKNIGKANETSYLEQAWSEMTSKVNKQRDKGYTDKPSKDEKILRPMLAKSYRDHFDKIEFPCFVQPKLDGMRSLALMDADVGLRSRLGKSITTVKHINKVLTEHMDNFTCLDGELYIHGKDFQKLISAIKRDTPSPDSCKIEYHVYDWVSNKPFKERTEYVKEIVDRVPKNAKIIAVETIEAHNQDEIFALHERFKSQGYEGSIIRNANAPYEVDKRTHNLLKLKDFLDEEFEIVGAEEDKNGHAVFTCITKDKIEFRVKPEGDDELRKRYWKEHKKLLGKMLTVRFFEWSTSENSVPRFPVGVSIRDYE